MIEPFLTDFADRNGLYLDFQKKSRKARKGKKVTWEDSFGNPHDLDYVLERDATAEKIGIPVAFVEVAWRRYTKHSRNKAQEIQGAILPLAEKHRWSNPFLGAVLAGEFTEASIMQLRSLGFHILYLPYDSIIAAFGSQGMNVAFNESTPDSEFQKCIRQIEKTSAERMQNVRDHLVDANSAAIERFLASLRERFDRMVEKVVVIPLYGRSNEFSTVGEALEFLDRHFVHEGAGDFRKYEIFIFFTNGDKVEASFKEKAKVKQFLRFIESQ